MPTKVIRIDKRKPGNTGWWSKKQRYQAVSTYLIMGKISLAAAAVGIPEITLRKWKAQPWWKEAEEEIKKSSKIELNGKISNVVNKSLLALEDRVENGDFFYNPGKRVFERKPINASVASRITNDLIGKTILLDKEVKGEKETDEGLEHRLDKLRAIMLEFSKGKTIEGEFTKVPEDAIV